MKQPKLFADSETFNKERPKIITHAQMEELLSKIAKEIISNDWSDSNEDEIIIDLCRIYPFNDSGFIMMQELDSYVSDGSYDPTVDFMEYLESLSIEVYKIQSENVKQWVKAHDINPKFRIGDCIKSKTDLAPFFINNIRFETAEYCISTKKDDSKNRLKDFEDIESKFELFKPL
jgi:hypothetical protein